MIMNAVDASVHIAIVGGGIAGSTALHTLSSQFLGNRLQVTLFDQGQRGVGGRTSHRRVAYDGRVVADDTVLTALDSPNFDSFDHGCQFFFASTERFQKQHVKEWLDAGVVRNWVDKRVYHTSHSRDFFGLLEYNNILPCYTGLGGMNQISRHLCAQSVQLGAVVRSGTRVSGTRPCSSGSTKKWKLFGTTGLPAFHDTKVFESTVVPSDPSVSLGEFDVVIYTDPSSSFEAWHRASAGACEAAPEMAEIIRKRPRVPLFTAMVTLESFSATIFPYDCAVFDSGPVWYACRNKAKPGFYCDRECWTLVSTPAFAVDQISEVPMVAVAVDSNKKTFLPQENSYLNRSGGPASVLCESFLDYITAGPSSSSSSASHNRPKVLYLQGQRWGSAVPGCKVPSTDTNNNVVEIGGTLYQKSIPLSLATGRQRDVTQASGTLVSLRIY